MYAKYSLHSLNRFDLAIQLSELQIAYEIASESEVGLLYGVFFLLFVPYVPLGFPSEWVSVTKEAEPSTNSADFDPMFPDLWNFPGDGVCFKVFYRNVA